MQLREPVQICSLKDPSSQIGTTFNLDVAWLSTLLVGYEPSVLKMFTFFLDILKADFSNVKTLEHTNCLHILSSYWLAQSEIVNKIWQVPTFLDVGSSKSESGLQRV
jgi:hypothetical protein